MEDLAAFLHRMGVPSSIVALVATVWIIVRELKPFHRPSRKSPREILSADEQSFRQALLDRLEVVEARGEASEKDRAALRDQLADCERRHLDAREHFDETVSELRQSLSACEDRHAASDERYDALAGKFNELVKSVKERGMDLLFDMAELAKPARLIDTAAYQGPDRRKDNFPVKIERRSKPDT